MAEQQSYLQEIIEKRKAFLTELRETDLEAYSKTLLKDLNHSLLRLGTAVQEIPQKITAQSIKAAPPTPKKSISELVQEKLLSFAKEQRDNQEQAAKKSDLALQTGRRQHEDGIDHLNRLQDSIQLGSIETRKQLEDVIAQLKKLNKNIVGARGSSALDIAEDLFEDAGTERKKKGRGPDKRPRKRRGKAGVATTVAEKIEEALEPTKTKPSILERGKGVLEKGKNVLGRISTAAGELMPKAGALVEKVPVAKLGGALAIGTGAYEVGTELASEKPAAEKATNVAKTGSRMAGGFLGAEAGATAGATLGAIGGPVGVAIGGTAGGIAGAIFGEEVVDKIATSLQDAVSESGFSDVLGRVVAVAAAPVSEDAREALVADYKNKIVPAFNSTFSSISETLSNWSSKVQTVADKIAEYTDNLEEGGKHIYSVVKQGSSEILDKMQEAGSTAYGGVKEAASGAARAVGQVTEKVGKGVSEVAGAAKAGYEKGGITEALKGAGRAVGIGKVPEEVARAAQASQEKYGIPAAVTAAQWQLESGGGKHMPAGSNNPFGIKATKAQIEAGQYVESMTTENIGGRNVRVPQKFAKYESLDQAFEQHAKLLATHKAYSGARQAGTPEEFAEALTGKYATDPMYGAKLKAIMAKQGLELAPAKPETAVAAKTSMMPTKENAERLAAVGTVTPPTGGATPAAEVTGAAPTTVATAPVKAPAPLGAVVTQPPVVQAAAGPVKAAVAANAPPTAGLAGVSALGPAPVDWTAQARTMMVSAKPEAVAPTTLQSTAKAQPVAMAAPRLPPEVAPVMVTNQQEIPAPTAGPSNAPTQVASSSASIELGDIPLRVDDFGLVLLNIGHSVVAALAVGLAIFAPVINTVGTLVS